MMSTNIRSLTAARAEKEGRITPEAIHETFGNWIDGGNLDSVVVVYLRKDGVIDVGWSENNNVTVLGLLETAKQAIIDEMRGD